MSKIFNCSSSKLIPIEVLNNKDYLEKRQKDLEDIKMVTNQIRQISEDMGIRLKDQGILIGKNISNYNGIFIK